MSNFEVDDDTPFNWDRMPERWPNWFNQPLDEKVIKNFYQAKLEYDDVDYDESEFASWKQNLPHKKLILFPDGLYVGALNALEADILVQALEESIPTPNHVLARQDDNKPNYFRGYVQGGYLHGEILLTFSDEEDETTAFRGGFHDGIPHGAFSCHRMTGQVIDEYELVLGTKHGRKCVYDYDSGERKIGESYIYGSLHGSRATYHASGRIKTLSEYKWGKREGPQKYWPDEDGAPYEETK